MHDFSSIEITKKGIEEAQIGNINQALLLFNQATDASFHIKHKSMRIKIGLAILTIQNLCDTIKSIIEDDFVIGNYKFSQYENYFDNYIEVCNSNTSENPILGCQYFIEAVSELNNLYQSQIELLKSK